MRRTTHGRDLVGDLRPPCRVPLGFLAREHEIRPGEYRPTGNVLQSMSLATLRRILRDEMGKSPAHHFKAKDSTMLEVWM